jgi:hypothetical protein
LTTPSWLTPAKRRGGALFPVLILSLILLMIATLLPQVLVSASNAMKTDVTRDRLLEAAESGVAITEAQLKRRITSDLTAGQPASVKTLRVVPSFDNPDFGKKKPVDYEAKLVTLKKRETNLGLDKEVHRYTYKIQTRAWTVTGRQLDLTTSGTLSFFVKVDRGTGGMTIKSVEKVTTEAFGREKHN